MAKYAIHNVGHPPKMQYQIDLGSAVVRFYHPVSPTNLKMVTLRETILPRNPRSEDIFIEQWIEPGWDCHPQLSLVRKGRQDWRALENDGYKRLKARMVNISCLVDIVYADQATAGS
ncbi:hypothetical protein ASPBRDRAFT_201746 [Aspergillus brasiliensis CBS 101740]|uniref:Uncharacterized protein n=1 Tax=Aspergillus brasiliensis (strain CBS 101740 / IMI 381727 / IBT 21946) TaxID=767769 RepID=A0A1L9U1K9_ASPBC|nr:hypothetical protein ASPBRDRAFT_201746 [Aspergillus brasiliensis CBS 101740]